MSERRLHLSLGVKFSGDTPSYDLYASLHITKRIVTLSDLWGTVHRPCRVLCLSHLFNIQPLHPQSERKPDAHRRKREVQCQLYRCGIRILKRSQYFRCSCEMLESCWTHCQHFSWTDSVGSFGNLVEKAIYKYTLTDSNGDASGCIKR